MKCGDTLMRLRRFRVDEMKRRMATLDGMKADAERRDQQRPARPEQMWRRHACRPLLEHFRAKRGDRLA